MTSSEQGFIITNLEVHNMDFISQIHVQIQALTLFHVTKIINCDRGRRIIKCIILYIYIFLYISKKFWHICTVT